MSIDRTRDGAVEIITLSRPDVLNAFDDEMGAALVEAVSAAAEAPEVRCIVVTGAGRAFSSGEDLGALASGYRAGRAPDLGVTLRDRYNPLIRAVTSAPKPVVAAVNGVAAGAGASLALACDFRIASDRAKLVLAFIKVGLIPDSGAIWFLTKMVGAARAWELCASGDPLDAAAAHDLGLFNRVVPPDAFESEWRSFAERLAAGPTRAYALMKELARAAAEIPLDEQLEREINAQAAAGRTEDHLEGVMAFLEKRAPGFRGE